MREQQAAAVGQAHETSGVPRGRACARRRAIARLLPVSAAAKSSAGPDVPLSVSSGDRQRERPSPGRACDRLLRSCRAPAIRQRAARHEQPRRREPGSTSPNAVPRRSIDQPRGARLGQLADLAPNLLGRRLAELGDAQIDRCPAARAVRPDTARRGSSSRTSSTSCGSAALPRSTRERHLRARLPAQQPHAFVDRRVAGRLAVDGADVVARTQAGSAAGEPSRAAITRR